MTRLDSTTEHWARTLALQPTLTGECLRAVLGDLDDTRAEVARLQAAALETQRQGALRSTT